MVQMDCGYMKKRRENPEREIQLKYLCLQAVGESTQVFPTTSLVAMLSFHNVRKVRSLPHPARLPA